MKKTIFKSILIMTFLAITMLLLFLGIYLSPKNIQITDEEFLGKIHFNDGTISSAVSDTSDATLVVERNPARQNLVITNVGAEVVYLWRKNYTGTTTATAEVERGAGIPLYPQGSYETWDNEYLWSGDIWVSTSSVAVTLVYDEK